MLIWLIYPADVNEWKACLIPPNFQSNTIFLVGPANFFNSAIFGHLTTPMLVGTYCQAVFFLLVYTGIQEPVERNLV